MRAQSLRAVVLPFVFRRYLDYNVFDALRILHRQIREHLAVDDDLRLGEAFDEAAVAEPLDADRRVDASYPEAAEGALPVAAVAVGIGQGLGDSVLGDLVVRVPAAPETLGAAQDFLTMVFSLRSGD